MNIQFESTGFCFDCNDRGSICNEKEMEFYRCKNCGSEWVECDAEGRISREQMLFFRPMQAGTFQYGKHDSFLQDDEYIIEKKLNGDRVLSFYTPKGGQFFTRTLATEDGLPVEKTGWLPYLEELCPRHTFILDGELVVPGRSDHTKVNSIFHCTKEKSLLRQKELGRLRYVVFDCLLFDGTDIREQPLDERIECRDAALEELQDCVYPRVRKHFLAPKMRFIQKVTSGIGKEFVEGLLKAGEEGAIIKHAFSPYVSDQRPVHWLKIKQENTLDLFISGFKDAKEVSTKSDGKTSKTKYAGMVGSVALSVMNGAKEAFVCYASGIPDTLRKEITENQKRFLKKVVEVKCQKAMRSKQGISLQNPRIIQVRSDKSKEDCTYKAVLAALGEE